MNSRRWRGEATTRGRYPLALPASQIRRILDRNSSHLILTRTITQDTYEIEDAHIIKRNLQHCKNGRHDLQADPFVSTIDITHIETIGLLELTLPAVRAAGHPTLEDFYTEWTSRRRINADQRLHWCEFQLPEDARYLHRLVHRGYTHNPREAIHGEPQALGPADLARYGTPKPPDERADRIAKMVRSLTIRYRQAIRAGNRTDAARIRDEMEKLEALLDDARCAAA